MSLMQMEQELRGLLARQLESLFGLDKDDERRIALALPGALHRTEWCFSHTKNKYYRENGTTVFSPFHSGQYSIFLYYLSNQIFRDNSQQRCVSADKVYYLNKALNAFDLYYEVEMPQVFFLDHPVGSVLGRATYGEYFSLGQNCTVGNNKGIYPTIGKNVALMAGATVVGRCAIGDNVIISAHSLVKDTDVPSNSIVFGTASSLLIKSKPAEYFLR
jgi:serine O-acetyltransferase